MGPGKLNMDDFFFCDHLHVTREVRHLKNLELKSFNAYCSRMCKDIDDSFCHHCFMED